jgi:hypothetical protein
MPSQITPSLQIRQTNADDLLADVLKYSRVLNILHSWAYLRLENEGEVIASRWISIRGYEILFPRWQYD